MKKRRHYFIFTFLIFVIVSTFTIAYSITFNNINYSYDTNNSLEENYIRLDYNDGTNRTYDYYISESSATLDLNRSDIISQINETKNHTFNGWYLTKSGFNSDGSSSLYKGEEINSGTILYAKYINNDTNDFTTINPSTSENGNLVYLSSYGILSSSYTINEGESVNIYYDNSNTSYNSTENNNGTAIAYPNQAGLYLILDSNILINGGTLQLNSVIGGNTSLLQNYFTDVTKFTCLDLNGYTITITNGGTLNGYGMIINSSEENGGIIVENGSLLTPFVVYGFGGGGKTASLYANTYVPFDNYLCPYLSCETLFYKTGKLIGHASLYANDDKHSTDIELIGGKETALLGIEEGFIIRNQTSYLDLLKEVNNYYSITNFLDLFTPNNYRESIILCSNPIEHLSNLNLNSHISVNKCKIQMNELTMTVSVGMEVTVSMRYVDFPIPSFFDIYGYNTDFTFSIGLIAMPSSTIFFDETSSIYFSTSISDKDGNSQTYNIYARISTLDEYPLDFKYKLNNGNYSYPDGSIPSSGQIGITNRLISNTTQAYIKIAGSLNFDDTISNFNLNSSYEFYSIGGNIDLSDTALNNLFENSDKVKISNYYMSSLFYSTGSGITGRYSMNSSRYYVKPLISYNKAYFQIGQDFKIVSTDKFDENNNLYYLGNDVYFYLYTTNNYVSSTENILSLSVLAEHAPYKTKFTDRFNNYQGNYVKADGDAHVLNLNGEEIFYITYNNKNYVYVSGAYIPVNETPSEESLASIPIDNINKFSRSENGQDIYSTGNTVYYDSLYLHRWRLNLPNA